MKYKIYFTILSRNYITIFLQKFSKKKENKFSSFKITNLKLYKTFYSRSYRISPPFIACPNEKTASLIFREEAALAFFTRPSSPLPPLSPSRRNVAPLSHNFRHAHGAHACACILWNSKGVVFFPSPLLVPACRQPFQPRLPPFFPRDRQPA